MIDRKTILVREESRKEGVMWSLSQKQVLGLDAAVCLLFTGRTGACAHFDPPMRATPVQAGEREMESPTSNIVQVPQGGMNPELCTVAFDDRPPLSQTFAQARLTLAVKTGRSSLGVRDL